MSKTRFMVIKLKELIKTAIFAVIGAAIIFALIVMIVPKSSDAKYKSGTYTSSVSIGDETAAVSLTFSENEITDMAFVPTSDTFTVLYPLAQTTADEIKAQIMSSQSTDTQVTGEIILNGAASCIERAKR